MAQVAACQSKCQLFIIQILKIKAGCYSTFDLERSHHLLSLKNRAHSKEPAKTLGLSAKMHLELINTAHTEKTPNSY